MEKIRYNKTELKRQRESLQKYERFLPMMALKKQQLQLELHKVTLELLEKEKLFSSLVKESEEWCGILVEKPDMEKMIQIEKIHREEKNIAGVQIPFLGKVDFAEVEYNLWEEPLWLDSVLPFLKNLISLREEIQILQEQKKILKKEWEEISQRLNLFEQILIPQARELIRRIRLYISEQQTIAVVRGKWVKNKLRKNQT